MTERVAVALLRRSTNMQDKSIAEQREFIATWAKAHGYTILWEYVDDAVSGDDHAHRTGFDRLMRDLERPGRQWSAILVYDRSRHTRADIFEAASYADRILKAGADVIYCVEGKSLSTEHEIVWAVETYQKHEVLKQTSRDTLRGMLALARKGFWCGGPMPYAYDAEIIDKTSLKPVRRVRMIRRMRTLPDGTKLPAIHHVLDVNGTFVREIRSGVESSLPLKSEAELTRLVLSEPARIEAVRTIFTAARRRGYKSITSELNSREIPPPGGHGLWRLTAVKAIIENPIYKGVFEWNSRTEAKYHSLVDGTMVARPRFEKARVVEHEQRNRIQLEMPELAIVSADAWQRAQERPTHTQPATRKRKPLQSHSLLGGKLFCGECGAKLYGTWTRKRKQIGQEMREFVQHLYVCSTYLASGINQCGYNKITRSELEQWVLARVRECMGQLTGGGAPVRERVREILEQLLGGPRESPEAVAKQLRELEKEVQAFEEVGPANRKVLKLEASYLEAKTRIERLRQRLTEPEARQPDVETLLDVVVELGKKLAQFDQLSPREQKDFLAHFVDRIDVDFRLATWGKRQHKVLKGGVLRLRSPLSGNENGGHVPEASATLRNEPENGSGGGI